MFKLFCPKALNKDLILIGSFELGKAEEIHCSGLDFSMLELEQKG